MIISISNHKGGVGKTTSTINIGAALHKLGHKVLIVDLDAQANLTHSLGLENEEKNIYKTLTEQVEITPLQYKENFDIIASTLDMSAIDIELSGEAGREFILKERLSKIKDKYDYILLDTPPSLGLLTINAFTASDKILIPLQAEYLALQGLKKLSDVIVKVQSRLNQNLELAGVFLTQFDSRKVLNREINTMVNNYFKDKTLQTKIRDNVSLAEAPVNKMDIFSYDDKSNGAKDYKDLTKEILEIL
ncbi:MAG: ParA family protein [Myroides sp.]|uniref:ParA family protein n=1 Tax=Empedobacter TaxID=59734 RepID=UPI002447C17A|nr:MULTISPECIES: ParA family protein [Empedobacter]MDH0675761.1 ParA family protein [Empedobacter sp. GD03861]MDH1884154.1 ParA family protein [Empedobacter sp. GD03797]